MKIVTRALLFVMCAALMLETALAAAVVDETSRVDAIMQAMTLDQKISQMIMPALRSWKMGRSTSLALANRCAAS